MFNKTYGTDKVWVWVWGGGYGMVYGTNKKIHGFVIPHLRKIVHTLFSNNPPSIVYLNIFMYACDCLTNLWRGLHFK